MKRKRVQTAFEYNNLEPRQLLATTPVGLNDLVAAEVIQFTEERTVFASSTSPTIWIQNAGETSVERIDLLPPETRLWGDIEAVGDEFRFQTRITDRDVISWVSDGTTAGTVQEEVRFQPEAGISVLGRKLVQDGDVVRYGGRILIEGVLDQLKAFEYEGKFYFTANGHLYASQGSAATTERLASGVEFDSLAGWNGRVYFRSWFLIYSTSGSAESTAPVFSDNTTLRSHNTPFVYVDDQFVFFARDSDAITRNGIWRVSEQHAVEFVAPIASNLSNLEYFQNDEHFVYFDALGSIFASNGKEVWELFGNGWAHNAIVNSEFVFAENDGIVFQASIDGESNDELLNLNAHGLGDIGLEGFRDGQLTFTATNDSIKQIDVSTNQVIEILEPVLDRYKARDRLVLHRGPENYFLDSLDGRTFFYSWNSETKKTTIIGNFGVSDILTYFDDLVVVSPGEKVINVYILDETTLVATQIAQFERFSNIRSAHISQHKLFVPTKSRVHEVDLQTGQVTQIYQAESGNLITGSWSDRDGNLYVPEGNFLRKRDAAQNSWETIISHGSIFGRHTELPDGSYILNGSSTLFLFDDPTSPPQQFMLPSGHIAWSIEVLDEVVLLTVHQPNSDRAVQTWRMFSGSTEFEFVDSGLTEPIRKLDKLENGEYLAAAGSQLFRSRQLSDDFNVLIDFGEPFQFFGYQNDRVLGATNSQLFSYSLSTNQVEVLLPATDVEDATSFTTLTYDGWLVHVDNALFFTDGTVPGTDKWATRDIDSLQVAGDEVFIRARLFEVVEYEEAPSNFRVTTTDDSGPGSLRQAILDASASPGFDHIRFDLPLGSVIQPNSPLPPITDPVYVGYSPRSTIPSDTPAIQIDGSNAGPNATGLSLFADDIIIRELAITNFSLDGIAVNRGNNVELAQNRIGVDLDHNPGGNGRHGIRANGTTNLQIQDNLIGANTREGIFLTGGGQYSLISNNHIGLTPTGAAVGNNNGIVLHAAHNRVIDNVIAGNRRNGIGIFNRDGQHSLFRGNQFGFADDASIVGNGDHGIYAQSSNLIIGGLNEPNSFIGNRLAGIFLRGSNDSIISYNEIGALNAEAGNGANGVRAINVRRVQVFENSIVGNGSTGVYIGAATDFSMADNEIGIFNSAPAGNIGFGVTLHSVSDSLIADNQIGSNQAGGIYTISISHNSFLNNAIGTDVALQTDLPNSPQGNGFGMILNGVLNVVGREGDGNTLTNGSTNLLVRGDRNEIVGNDFDSNVDSMSRVHLFLAGSAKQNIIERNTFANARLGLRNFTSTWNRFSENEFGIGLQTGIDNGPLGIQANDPDDLDEGPNRGLNSPAILAAVVSNGKVEIEYDLDIAEISATYPLTIEFYKQTEDELGLFLISDLAFTNGPHTFDISLDLFELSVGDRIRALTIDGEGNTSELSLVITIE